MNITATLFLCRDRDAIDAGMSGMVVYKRRHCACSREKLVTLKLH